MIQSIIWEYSTAKVTNRIPSQRVWDRIFEINKIPHYLYWVIFLHGEIISFLNLRIAVLYS